MNTWGHSGFFDSVANAFAKIEMRDIRVSDINISRDYLTKIVNDPNIRSHMNTCVRSQLDISTGSLWGASIHIVPGIKKFSVLGEPLFLDNRGNRYTAPVFGGPVTGGMVIIVKTRAPEMEYWSPKEARAVETLREMITESEFRKYVKYGFIMVQGQSGVAYQVFRDKPHTKVWKNGQIIEEVCVRIPGGYPKTDNVIAFKTMIETDENEFKKCGNVYKLIEAA